MQVEGKGACVVGGIADEKGHKTYVEKEESCRNIYAHLYYEMVEVGL